MLWVVVGMGCLVVRCGGVWAVVVSIVVVCCAVVCQVYCELL